MEVQSHTSFSPAAPTHIKRRLVLVFIFSFVLIFSILNVRFVFANVQYWFAPGTIQVRETLTDAVALLPLAEDVTSESLPDSAWLVIDSIGVNAPIVFGSEPTNDALYKALEDGVVHYSSTPKPGLDGVSVLLGHSSAYPWYPGEYGSVFALLGKLNPGDRFYIQYENGRTFVFEMKQSIIFNPFSSDSRLPELEQSDTPSLIMISCYPVGTNYRRIAIQAHLVTL